jgi:signal transduction histidine kinase
VVEDFLDVSRLENGRFDIFKEPFDIRAALLDVFEVMHFAVEQKSLAFNLQIEEEVPQRIISDQKRIKQVFFNLIGNAVKFTYDGHITIKMSIEKKGESKILRGIVEDTGVGIKEEDIGKLFKFFG